jgi:hypothetical protein
MADIFDAYALADAWDEMFVRPGEVTRTVAAWQTKTWGGLSAACAAWRL